MNKRVIGFYLLDQLLSLAGMGVAVFWSAGRFDWWPPWAGLAVWLVTFAAMDILLLRFNPGLMAERLSPPQGAKGWDRAILSVLRLVQLGRYILAGLDQRYGWTGSFPLAAQWAAVGVCLLGQGLLVWAMASNAFFSQIVRIQSDRGQRVVTVGPYRLVRHPAYVGMILFDLAMSTLLGSWPAILAGAVCAALILLRTGLEDRTLQAGLAGYGEYARRVRYRLLPGVW